MKVSEERSARAGERKVRVMLFSHAFSPGGPRRQADALSELVNLQLIGSQIWKGGYWPVTELEASRYLIEVPRIHLFGHQHVLASLTMGMRSFQPDIIHVDYDPWSLIFWQVRLTAMLFARRSRFVVGAKKNTYRRYGGSLGWLKNRIGRLGLRWSDRVEAASELASEMYQREFGCPRQKIDVIPHMGVDTDVFKPVARKERDECVVGFCGELSARKGVEALVGAVALLRERGSNITLRLLGFGPLEEKLRTLESSKSWLTIVRPVPNDEVAEFLQELDLYVLPASVLPDHQEHDAHALLQALSCGVASIGTRSGIIPEILGDGTGVVVEPDDLAGLSAAIQTLAVDAKRRESLAERGKAKAIQSYSLEAVARLKYARYLRMLRS